MRRGRVGRRSPVLPEDAPLQITSMADVFMILLVFLLKTYTTGMSSIVPPQGMKLPETQKSEKITEALKVEITDSAIRLDGNPVTTLTDYQFKSDDLSSEGQIDSLKRGLASLNTEQSKEGKGQLLVLADQRTPYRTLKTVLNTAALTGWRDFRLVVVEDR